MVTIHNSSVLKDMLTSGLVTFQNNPNNSDIMRILSHIIDGRVIEEYSYTYTSALAGLLYLNRETVVVLVQWYLPCTNTQYLKTGGENEERNKLHHLVTSILFQGFRQSHNSAHQFVATLVKTPLLLHFTTVVLCSKNGK